MELTKIVLGGIVGTTLMTLFSYVCGRLFSKEFGEPKLLNKLLDQSYSWENDINSSSPIGWILHFTIGLLFAWIMYLFFLWSGHSPTWPLGGLLGFVFGILGVAGWALFLNLQRSPPELELPEFYFQLIVAHVVFGLGAVLVFKAFNGAM